MKLVKACIAMAAFAAIFVVPSIASAASPTLRETTANGENHVLAAGTLIEAENVVHSSTGTVTKLTTPGGINVECTTAFVTGKLVKNAEGHIEGEITTADFTGTPSIKPHTSHCVGSGNLGKVTVTTGVTAEAPWCITASGLKDEFIVRGGKCGAAANISFTLDTAIGACTYSKASVDGTFTTHPADAVATIDNTESFPKTAGSIFCPASGTLDMAFTLRTDNVETGALNIK